MFRKGKYGVLVYADPELDPEPRPHLWVILIAVLVVGIALFSARGCFNSPAPAPIVPPPPSIDRTVPDFRPAAGVPSPAVAAQPIKKAALPEAPHHRVSRPARERSGPVRTLLERLNAARSSGDVVLEIDTIERLRLRKDEVADIDDMLARRLGNLNRKLMLEGARSPWTEQVSVRVGDTVQQIARENGNTVAAVLWLNGIDDPRRLRVGANVRVLARPKVKIEIHAASGIADLKINGKFFRRYDAKVPDGCELGERIVTREREGGPRAILSAAGIGFGKADLVELCMLLAPDSRIVVLNP